MNKICLFICSVLLLSSCMQRNLRNNANHAIDNKTSYTNSNSCTQTKMLTIPIKFTLPTLRDDSPEKDKSLYKISCLSKEELKIIKDNLQ